MLKFLMTSFVAAVAEIVGCFSFWAWQKQKASWLYLIPGTLSLWLFAYLLTRLESEFSGRAYAAYGALYILTSLGWMWAIEGEVPNKWDALGVLFCLAGAFIFVLSAKT